MTPSRSLRVETFLRFETAKATTLSEASAPSATLHSRSKLINAHTDESVRLILSVQSGSCINAGVRDVPE